MEVAVAVPPPPPSPPPSTMDFNFDSNCSSPYITAPSSPQRFDNNFFFSAPASPTRTFNNSSLFHFNPRHSSASTFSAPQPNTNTNTNTNNEDDFEFDFGINQERPSLSADELFVEGKIRPLKPPSPLPTRNKVSSNRKERRVFEPSTREGGTHKRIDYEDEPPPLPQQQQQQQHKQGRGKRASSFSIPLRTITTHSSRSSDCDDVASGNITKSSETTSPSNSSFLSTVSFTKGYRKWRIKDFLLFRSASEGRATDKDPLRKYAVLSKTTAHEDVRNSSFRSAGSSGSISRRRGPVSAHELHYTTNRAASEELKRKTLLPYKQGLLGCLGFNSGMHHFSRRIGSFERS